MVLGPKDMFLFRVVENILIDCILVLLLAALRVAYKASFKHAKRKA